MVPGGAAGIGAGVADGSPSVARGAAPACSSAPITFEEISTETACSGMTGDEAGPAAREGAEISRSRARSAPTSASSRTTLSRSHAASPRAASAARSARKENTPRPRRQAAAFLDATRRS